METFDRRLMAHTDAEQEPIGEGFGDGLPAGLHGHRRTSVQTRDTRGEDQFVGGRQEQGGRRERFTTHGFGNPHRREAQLFDLCSELLGFAHGLNIELERPESEFSEGCFREGHAVKLGDFPGATTIGTTFDAWPNPLITRSPPRFSTAWCRQPLPSSPPMVDTSRS